MGHPHATTTNGALAIPSVPLAIGGVAPTVVLGLAMVCGLLAMHQSLLGDPDTQWHIEVGRRIWEARVVPSVDLFSHTFKGTPWIAKEWVSQLAFYSAHRFGGWTGVVLLAASSVTFAFGALNAWLGRTLKPTMALVLTLSALVLAMPHVLARPHILVLSLVVVWLTTLVGALDRQRAPPLLLAALMMPWANMHGSFPLGLVLAGILAGEGVIAAPSGLVWTRARQWVVFLAVSLAATLVSPQGWRALVVSLKMSGNAATLAYVDEWHPLALDWTGCFALALLVLLAAALFREPRTNLFRILATAFLAYLMIRHQRFISLFGVIAPILAARAIARCGWFADRAEVKPSALPSVPIAALVLLAVALTATIHPRLPVDVAPDEAYRAAVAAGVSGPVYNDYDFGGFLIAHGVETFVDGRTDQLFLGPFLPNLSAALLAKSDMPFATLLRRYGVTWALVRAGSNEARHLDHMSGWRLIHADPTASVYRAS